MSSQKTSIRQLLSATLILLQQRKHTPLQVIKACAVLCRRVSLLYRKIDGKVVQRQVEPYSIREGRAKDGTALFYGFDVQAETIKAFKLNGLLHAFPVGLLKSFQPRWAVELGL